MKRLLCIISAMNTGGAETFLMKLYRKLDISKYQMDFCVNLKEEGFYDKEIIKRGGKIFYVPPKSNGIIKFNKGLRRIISENSYQYVMRVTSNTMGFMDLAIAKKAGAKVCIARSSNSSDGNSIKTKLAHKFGQILFEKYIDVKIAPSDLAAKYTFGEKDYKKGKVNILNNALDLELYKFDFTARKRIRDEYKIKNSEILIGHIGRFTEQKNHKYLLKVFSELYKEDKRYKLMLVGTGELEYNIKVWCKNFQVEDRVIFMGVRKDIPALMSAMDLFVLPSFYEGMPNTVIEAQAVGLSCIISNTITREANVTGNVIYLPINKGTDSWKKEIANVTISQDRLEQNLKMKDTVFNIDVTIKKFIDIVFEGKNNEQKELY